MAINPNPDPMETNTISTAFLGSPADTGSVSSGALNIRDTRAAVRAIVSQEHYVNKASEPNDSDHEGKHVPGSARVFVDTDEPSNTDEGRVWFNSETDALAVAVSSAYVTVRTLPAGLIAMMPIPPDPETDGWAVCDGTRIDSGADPYYADLVEYLNPGESTAYLPDLRNRFVRGVDSEDERAPDTTVVGDGVDAAYNFQAHGFKDHVHDIGHDHEEFDTESGGTFTADSYEEASLTEDGVLTVAAAEDTKVNGIGTESVTDHYNFVVSLAHSHEIDVPELTDVPSGPALETDGEEFTGGEATTETRPDNVALYFVIKL